jgi:glycosyltransferase involved in cell wall biosynthesis
VSVSYQPLISIVVPVYNVDEVWLKAAIESVCNQTYGGWELCIADDVSTKPHINTVLNEYADRDKRIKAIFLESNQGISGASNAALNMATCEFFGLLDLKGFLEVGSRDVNGSLRLIIERLSPAEYIGVDISE